MSLNLTPKQQHILKRIREYRLTVGYSPTLQELADELNISKVTVFEHVEALIRKGALKRDPNKARSLELSDNCKMPDEERSSRLPLLGQIAAGSPLEAVEDNQSLDLESIFAPTPRSRAVHFALRVKGDSMIEDHICDGDYVICQQATTARNGQIVVALLPDGQATLKRFFKEKTGIRLQPANASYKPILVDQCAIQGVMIGIIRQC